MKTRTDPKVSSLREFPLFATCSSSELGAIAAVADEISLAPGRRLTVEGAAGDELVLIVAGTAAVTRHGQVIATLGAGDVVGEIALLTDRPRSATVVATSPIRILVIARSSFRSMVYQFPDIRLRLDELASLRDAS